MAGAGNYTETTIVGHNSKDKKASVAFQGQASKLLIRYAQDVRSGESEISAARKYNALYLKIKIKIGKHTYTPNDKTLFLRMIYSIGSNKKRKRFNIKPRFFWFKWHKRLSLWLKPTP